MKRGTGPAVRAGKVSIAVLGVVFAAGGAHRLDRYLQETVLSIQKDRVHGAMTLTPGTTLFAEVAANIDLDGDGSFSSAERQAYVQRVLGEVALSVDGKSLQPQLVSAEFSSMAAFRGGLGDIQIEFDAGMPSGDGAHTLRFANRHQLGQDEYRVSSRAPEDRDLRIVRETRNASHSEYELEYTQGVRRWESTWLGVAAVLLASRLAYVWWRGRGSHT